MIIMMLCWRWENYRVGKTWRLSCKCLEWEGKVLIIASLTKHHKKKKNNKNPTREQNEMKLNMTSQKKNPFPWSLDTFLQKRENIQEKKINSALSNAHSKEQWEVKISSISGLNGSW